MLFGKSYLLLVAGLGSIFFGVAMTYFIPFLWTIPIFIIGVILSFISLGLIQWRANETTLNYLLDPDEKPNEKLWLYIWGDREIEVIPSIRIAEKQTYSKKLDQQAKSFVSYRFAGHSVFLIPSGIGHSVDAGAGLYCQIAKNKWRADTLTKLRNLFRDKKGEYNEAKVYDTSKGVPSYEE